MTVRHPPKLSVVVPTYLRIDALSRCLCALVSQDLLEIGPDYEIVVIDDARDDATRNFVTRFAHDHAPIVAIRYLRPPAYHHGPAATRNAGWRAATGEIIAFTDDDTIPTRSWLREGLAVITPDIGAVWGHVEVPLPDRPTDAERNTAGLHGAEFLTANCFVRRHALEAVGGFDERFQRPWREDSDLYFSLLEARFLVLRAPAAVVIHPPRKAPPGTCLKQHRNLFYDALLYKKHPRLYREKISAGPPLRYYVAVAMFVLAVFAALAGAGSLALVAGGLWLMLSLHLALRRLRGISQTLPEVAEIVLTSFAIPFFAVYWRLAGSLHYRVVFA